MPCIPTYCVSVKKNILKLRRRRHVDSVLLMAGGGAGGEDALGPLPPPHDAALPVRP
jgi:hypothetical protein